MAFHILESNLGDATLTEATVKIGDGDAKLMVVAAALRWGEITECNVVAVLLCVVLAQRHLQAHRQPFMTGRTQCIVRKLSRTRTSGNIAGPQKKSSWTCPRDAPAGKCASGASHALQWS